MKQIQQKVNWRVRMKDMWKCLILFLQLYYESEIISKSSYQKIIKVRKKIF